MRVAVVHLCWKKINSLVSANSLPTKEQHSNVLKGKKGFIYLSSLYQSVAVLDFEPRFVPIWLLVEGEELFTFVLRVFLFGCCCEMGQKRNKKGYD